MVVQLQNLDGHLVVLVPTLYDPAIQTKSGTMDAVFTHVCDVTTGEVFRDQMIVARQFVDGMRDYLNHPFIGVVRRLEDGGFTFDSATDDQHNVARDFLDGLSN
jgi:hypothetical protein